jgi:hypothetical protein
MGRAGAARLAYRRVWQLVALPDRLSVITHSDSGIALLLLSADQPVRDVPLPLLVLGILIGILLAIASPANYEPTQAGGYLWDIVTRTPKLYGRPLLFILAAPAGVVALFAIARRAWSQLGYKVAILWSISWLAWSSTFIVNRQMFQRYMEPTILLLLVLIAAPLYESVAKRRDTRFSQRASLVLLTLFQIAVTMMTWYRTFR